MSMYEFSYVSCGKAEAEYVADTNYLEGEKTWYYRKKIGNRYINYYIRNRIGYNKLLNGQHYRLFLFLPQKAGDFIKLVNKISISNYVDSEMKKTFHNCPYLIISSYLWMSHKKSNILEHLFDEEVDKIHEEHPETFHTIKPVLGYYIGAEDFGENIAICCDFDEGKFNSQNERGALINTIKYADNLMREIMNIRLDLDKLIIKNETNTQSSDIPPFIKKALIYGGVYAVKFAARMVGADFNANIDFDVDIPDVHDLGGVDLGVPDFEFDADFDTDFDVGSLDSDGTFGNIEGGDYNVSFQGQKETLHTPGDGQHLDVTITKEHGSSNLFTISSDKGTVHHVSGTDSSVRINGIKYILPKLKG